MAGEIGQALQESRGFLADTLGRFDTIDRKRAEERTDHVQLGDHISGMFDPLSRFMQIGAGLPGSTTWGGAWRGNPTADWLLASGAPYLNPFAKPADPAQPGQNTGPGSYPQPGPSPYTGGSGQAATSADNQALTGARINDWIARTRGNSPLAGMGDYILQTANQYGISAPLMLGIFLKESELGVTAGSGKILSGITDPGRDQGLGGTRAFQGFGTWQEAIDATARNLATGIYKGKSVNEQIGNWYVGPQAYAAGGLGATDKAGNGTVGDYVNLVANVYRALGVPFNAAQPAQTVAPRGGTSPGGNGLTSIWGGANAPITQEIGVVSPGIDQSIYAYGQQFGFAGGHTGLDIGVRRGTQLYMPAGFSGTVIERAPGYYKDEDYGDNGQSYDRGELRIQLDNGWQLILGHNSKNLVMPGTKVTAGQLLALSGSANGDHVHLELRIPDPSTPSGWRIVDPRQYLTPAAGAGEGP
jgi:murein DD-endopeptidase MepM/ murein hydrolase activator NlpD